MPEQGQEETVRIVALDRSFHVNCYVCEVSHRERQHKLVVWSKNTVGQSFLKIIRVLYLSSDITSGTFLYVHVRVSS